MFFCRFFGGRLDCLEIVHADTLQPLTDIAAPAVIALAVFLGKTRLIDNLRLCPQTSQVQ